MVAQELMRPIYVSFGIGGLLFDIHQRNIICLCTGYNSSAEHNLFVHCGYKLLTAKWIAFFYCTISVLAQIFLTVVHVVIADWHDFSVDINFSSFKAILVTLMGGYVGNHTFRLPLWVMKYSASFVTCNMYASRNSCTLCALVLANLKFANMLCLSSF